MRRSQLLLLDGILADSWLFTQLSLYYYLKLLVDLRQFFSLSLSLSFLSLNDNISLF